MQNPKLSIITPVFQGSKYMAECIESVAQQNCDTLEHIIIDGGSTDGTVDILKEYAAKYEHIRYISEKDEGQSSAMNKGLKMAKGAIIGFLNADDYYETNILNRIVDLFSGLSDPSFIVGNCNVIDENKNILEINKPKKLGYEDLLLGNGYNPLPVNPSAYFYHKSVHEKIGFYDESKYYLMDTDFILKVVTIANVKYIDELWGHFRFIEGTKTYNANKDGSNSKRVQILMDSHINRLFLAKRLRIKILRYLHLKYFYKRLFYYLEKPKRILLFFQKKDGIFKRMFKY